MKAAERYGSSEALCYPCDVASDEEIEAVFTSLSKQWDGLDGIIHAVGFAPGNELDGNFADVATREGFRIAHDISSYSFVALANSASSALPFSFSRQLPLHLPFHRSLNMKIHFC